MKLIMIGHGGHSKVVTDIALQAGFKIISYLDDKYETVYEKKGIIYGPITCIAGLIEKEPRAQVIVAIGDNAIRQILIDKMLLDKERYATLVHSRAWISPHAVIGNGSVVMANAVVQAGSIVRNHVIVNTNAVVEHDSMIDDFVHIAPNATLTGMTVIKTGVQVGASATILPGKTIGEWAIIGAGATVIHDLPKNCTAMGVPAKIKQKVGDSLAK